MNDKTQVKNITRNQLELIRLLDDYEINIFTLTSVEKQVHHSFKNIQIIADRLTQKGLLSRIEKGKYCRHNFRDEWVIGNYLVKDGVIAYWSALNRHGLTEQFPNTIFVQTSKEKEDKTVFGIDYKFIKVVKRKLIGYEMYGIGNNQYRMTDVEKTITDCFDLPDYSGGYAELIRAFNTAPLNAKKMIKYCAAINNMAVTKRIAFLGDFLKKPNFEVFLKYAKEAVNDRYILFDPIGFNTGEHIKEWKIRLNVSREEILDICNKMY